MNESEQRERFEEWIQSPPFEQDVSRFPDGETKYAWPGNYRRIDVELAWQAWLESARQSETAGVTIKDCIGVVAMMGDTASTYGARTIGIKRQSIQVTQ